MDDQFHLTLYFSCAYLSMQGLKLIYISKMGNNDGLRTRLTSTMVHVSATRQWLLCLCINYSLGRLKRKLDTDGRNPRLQDGSNFSMFQNIQTASQLMTINTWAFANIISVILEHEQIAKCHGFLCYVIILPCSKFRGGLTTPFPSTFVNSLPIDVVLTLFIEVRIRITVSRNL